MSSNIIEEELAKSTIFKDESKLFPEYVPPTLPCRENQLRKLASIFKILVKYPGKAAPKALVLGKTGTGKTVTTKFFGSMLCEAAQKRGVKLHYVHINCRKYRTPFTVLRKITSMLIDVPERGFSDEELLAKLQDALCGREDVLLVALDEADYFIRSGGGELIYKLTRLMDEVTYGRQALSLILIAKDDTPLLLLDDSVRGGFQRNLIYMPPYTSEELKTILRNRVEEAFHENVVSDEIIEMIAQASSKWGDARYAIELLYLAGKNAECEGACMVLPEHVRKAIATTHPEVRAEELAFLDKHQMLLLLAIARELNRTEKVYLTTGEAEQAYTCICEEYGETPRKHTQLWKYLRELHNMGLITIRISGKNQRGKTSLISIDNAPTTVMIKVLENELKKT